MSDERECGPTHHLGCACHEARRDARDNALLTAVRLAQEERDALLTAIKLTQEERDAAANRATELAEFVVEVARGSGRHRDLRSLILQWQEKAKALAKKRADHE